MTNKEDPDKMQNDAAFYQGVHCLLRIKTTFRDRNKARKMVKSRKRYNQVTHQAKGTEWESNKNTINITNKSQNVSPFPAGDHKAVMNRRKSMRNTRHNSKNDPHKKYRLGTISKINYWRTLIRTFYLRPLKVHNGRSHSIHINMYMY